MSYDGKIVARTVKGLFIAAGIMGTTMLFAAAAGAAECPADKVEVDVTKPVSTGPKGVTDKVLAAIDLGKEPANLADRDLRLRRLVIQPGGIVPWHSHADRPAIIIILSGEIIEYASNCSVPIVHKPGDVSTETGGTSHWWENKGSKTVVLLSADILHDKKDHNM